MKDSGVLFVDDDQDILRLITIFFECEGMEVHCAASGEEALLKIRERNFRLMVTDLDMPGLNGFELARQAGEMAPNMSIIMSTGDLSPDIPRLAREAGIAGVFAKPFKFEKILTMVEREERTESGGPSPGLWPPSPAGRG